jgi:hypothetical protein
LWICAFLWAVPTGLGSLRQQQLQMITAETSNDTVIGRDDRIRNLAFRSLKFENFFFDRVAGDKPVCEYVSGLADPVTTVDGLRFDCRIPPRIQQKNIFGGSQVPS